MKKAKPIALGFAVLILIIVVFQNTQDATVSVLLVKVTMPLALLLALILSGGFVCGIATAMVMGRKDAGPPKV